MKDNHTEQTMAGLLTYHLEKTIPEGADLWPAIRKRLAERSSAAQLQRRRSFGGIGFHRPSVLPAMAVILAGIIGLHLWMSQPQLVDAQVILDGAQNAQASPSNSGIRTFTLTQKIDERSSSGEFHAETRRWYQDPGQWRVESRWTGAEPEDEGMRTVVSDGTSEWIQQGDSVIISQATQQPVTDDLAPWGREISGLTDVLNQVDDLYSSPRLQGEETIAGRPAYVLDLGLPNRFSNSAPDLNNGRRVIWVDKETFFLLKAVQYSPTDGSTTGVMEVTQVQYNIPIEPGVFSFTPPPGARVDDLRVGRYSSLSESNPSSPIYLDKARQKVSFAIFIPTVVPAGLVPELPTIDEGTPALVRINYRAADGNIGLSVLNGPAGSGLAADPRKKGETIWLRGDIAGHFLNIEPQFGGPILWWEETGSYVALSGPGLGKTDLVKIAVSMSPTADIE